MADATRTLQLILTARDEATKVVKGFAGSLGDLTQKAELGAGIIAGSLGLIGKTAIEAGSLLEQSRIAFNTMIGDSQRAATHLEDLSRFAMKTPFTLPGIIEASKKLQAYGYSVDQVLPLLKDLGNVTAGVGADKLPFLVMAMGQVKAATRLTGEEIRQFRNAGVPILDELAKYYGKTAGEVQEMVEAQQVSAADVEETFRRMSGEGGRFFNLMERQSKTFGGVMSNISDNLFRMAAVMVGVSVTGEIIAGGLFDRLSQAAQTLLNVLNVITPQVSAFMAAFLANGPAVYAVLGGLATVVGLLVFGLVSLIAPALAFIAIGMALGAAIGLIVTGIREGNPLIIGLTAALAALGAILLASVIPAIVAWVTTTVTGAAAMIIALLPILWPVIAIGAAVALLALIWKNNWGDIQGKTKAVVDWFQNTAWPVLKKVLEAIGAVIKFQVDAWVAQFNMVKGAAEGVIGAIRGIISAAQDMANRIKGGLKIPGFQHGGFVPGPSNQAVPAILHGGERVIPRTGVDVNNGGGGPGVTINFSGPVNIDSEERVQELADKIIRILGRQNEWAAKGLSF